MPERGPSRRTRPCIFPFHPLSFRNQRESHRCGLYLVMRSPNGGEQGSLAGLPTSSPPGLRQLPSVRFLLLQLNTFPADALSIQIRGAATPPHHRGVNTKEVRPSPWKQFPPRPLPLA